MPTVMNRALFKKELQRGLNAVFGMEYRRYPEQWKFIFDTETSEKAYEEDVLMAGLGPAAIKPEGQGVTYDGGGESYVSRYVHETIALAFAITEEAVEDGLYGNLASKFSKALARSMQHTKEVKGANVLNFADNSSYLGGDGKKLLATDHPLYNGGTLSNRPTTMADLSEATLEDALVAIQNYVDDRGIPVAATGVRLIVPPALQFTAERLLMSSFRPGTADNDVNAMKSRGMLPGGFEVVQRLSDTNAWFIKTDVPDGLKHIKRLGIQRGVEGDFETGNMRYKARERYSFGWSDFRGVHGSTGGS